MAVESLPNELIDCILDNLSCNKIALSNCSLVEKAWVLPSQRRIFEKLGLNGHADSLVKTERLIAIFDEKPHLASSVRLLNLWSFNNVEGPEKEMLHARIAEGVIQRLSKVETIELDYVYWPILYPLLRTALSDAFQAHSLTRIAITGCSFHTFADLASLLSHATYLKALTIRLLNCGRRNEPTASDFAIPRSIKLDEFATDDTDTFTPWFKEELCPIAIRYLRFLRMRIFGRNPTTIYQSVAFIVRHAGFSLTKLELEYQNGLGDSGLIHLGHIPNLDSFVLDICKSRAGTDILIPWIRSFFEPLLNLDGHTHPLRHFTLVINIDFDESDPDQWEWEWDQYAVLNRLFAQPVFAPLGW
ncbi:hypothetical protein BT96DRAFT_1025231 [Gymnopus androsaceus JB14]|uniref:F-box domain-containing protein n=1 Tax=Gymnopus androsaceus JB14 TaxID=1447944 RepID=A0A6A4GV84_9AGAR|nr:hypothetical protein BT96DRAFT_1025231 [Gymnopus androsaceus JB14]